MRAVWGGYENRGWLRKRLAEVGGVDNCCSGECCALVVHRERLPNTQGSSPNPELGSQLVELRAAI